MGRFTGPEEIKTAEDAEDAADFGFFLTVGRGDTGGATFAEEVFLLFSSAFSATSAVFTCV
jgi:hypothetical protein